MPDQTQHEERPKLRFGEAFVLAALVCLYLAAGFFSVVLVAAVLDHLRSGAIWSEAFSDSFSALFELAQAISALAALLALSYPFARKIGISKKNSEVVPGCLFCSILLILTTGLVVKFIFGGRWGAAFDGATDVAIVVLIRLFRAILACSTTVAIIFLIARATKWLSAKKAGPDVIASYLGDFVPIKPLMAIVRFFSESESSLKQAVSGETPWFVPVLAVSLTFFAVIGIEGFLHLPPMTPTAASAIYRGAEEQPLLVDSVITTLEENTNDQQTERLSKIPSSVRLGFLIRINSPEGLAREAQMERIDMSLLGVGLEWIFGIRSGDDLIRALPAGFSDRVLLKTVVDDLERANKSYSLTRIATMLIPFCFAFGVSFWLASGRHWRFTAAMAVSSILLSVLLLVHELALASTSIVSTLFEAHAIAAMTQFAALQVWLIGIIPQATGIGARRCWIAGTCAFALAQAIGVAAFVALAK